MANKKKSEDKIRVQFCGTNASEVTGSMVLISYLNKKILLCAGLHQSNNLVNDYEINVRSFDFNPKEINYLFLEQIHADHSLLTPRLYKEGCKAQIITHNDTVEFLRPMMEDSCHILKRDMFIINKTYPNAKPLYEQEDIDNALNHVRGYSENVIYQLDDIVSFELKNAQHIVGSCQVIIYIKEKTGHIKKIGFSGDLGNTLFDNPFVKQFEPITKCNCFIGESTYSNPLRSSKKKDRDKDIEKIKTIVNDYCIDKKSRVIFPVFAMQRLQTILKVLYDIFGQDKNFKIPIYIDTPLGIKITNLFKEVLTGEQKELIEKILSWENVKMINDVEESKLCVINNEPKIVLSSSGMINAGRSVNYVKEYLPNPTDCIVTCGFMAEGSIGWQIRNAGSKVNIKIDSKLYKNKCQIFNLLSFSSHMQFEQLVNYYKSISTEVIYLVHGNSTEKLILKEALEKEFSRLNKTTKVIAVKQDDVFYI